MTQNQIDYYNSLPEQEQYVLDIAALKAFKIDSNSIQDVARHRYKLQIKQINTYLDNACACKLFNKQYKYSYIASIPFFIYILPKYPQYSNEWKLYCSSKQELFSFDNNNFYNIKKYLFSLLFSNKDIIDTETYITRFGFDESTDALADILDYEPYQNVISLINTDLLLYLINIKLGNKLKYISSLKSLNTLEDKLTASLSKDKIAKLPSFKGRLLFHSGNVLESINQFGDEQPSALFASATHALIEGNITESLALFEKGLKAQRVKLKNSQLPIVPHFSFYYLTSLLCSPPELSSPIFRKISTAINKKTYSVFEVLFNAVPSYVLNEKRDFDSAISSILYSLRYNKQDFNSLICLLILYLADKTPHETNLENFKLTVKKAYAEDYVLLAYEGAFVIKQWCEDEEINDLFNKISKELNYQPALSRIYRQDEWELSLNALLSLTNNKNTTSAKDEQEKYRIVYYINFKYLDIQPVLQSRNAKGVWSKGRNIALKSFHLGNADGMTPLDIQVSKYIKKSYGGYYGNEDYHLDASAIVELIGHPLVFLNGSADIPVELIAAQPVLIVTKKASGYILSTDIADASENIFVEKETNTRYRVYNLTSQQQTIIRAIRQQSIVIPDQGKEKLMQVLANFSSHLTVHSDLMVSDNTNIKQVEADSRIRVQLLPLGDGLKAEIFAKPFGSHPPYCKPGKGGKTLIANENGEQLQVTRDLATEKKNADLLMEQIQSLESIDMSNELIAFDDPRDSLNLLDILANYQDNCVVEWPEGEKYKIKGSANFANLSLSVKSKANWFELQGELKVDENTVITIQQLLELSANSNNRFIELKQGEFLALSEKLKRQLEELKTFSSIGKDSVQINKFASVALNDLFDDVANFKADKSWKDFHKRIDSIKNIDIQVPSNLQAELRPYQEEGFRWLSRLASWEGGACLADDMGLGKTIQTLAILLHRAKDGAALVVCPVSVIPNWISEATKFAPSLNVITLSSGNREQTFKNLQPGDLLITSYGLLQSEEKTFAQTSFATIVLDEAHAIKNFNTKTSKAVMQLQAPFRLALTGTPIQNHLGEVWNLFNFINPGLLGTLTHFNDKFIKSDNDHARKHLKKLITPFILRRTKSTVLDELPPKTEIIRKVQLSDDEMAFYEALRRQAIINLESEEGNQGSKHLKALAEITRLRQVCCNPALVNKNTNISSTKLSTFLEIAAELIDNKHKALVFSQFVTHLSIVREALDNLGIRYQYLDGSCSIADREQSVKNFQAGDGDLFLISLKAGGLGLNLTAADYVIHLDPWWNPAVEDQASDRAHRFGQSRPVTIYRLVAENTIEEKIIRLHNTKRDLADSLLEGSDKSAKLSINELVDLIRERE